MRQAKIVVIGSLNMDLVLPVPRLPVGGETLAGGTLREIPGGKGANQAVAAARLGGAVAMVGRVGTDAFGGTLRNGLAESGVDVRHVLPTPGPSGTAVILVQAGGENSIVLSGGANDRLTVDDVDAALPLIRAADVVMLQLEVAPAVVTHAIALCRSLGVRVILDPAPAPGPMPDAWAGVDVLCPNESEARTLLGDTPTDAAGAAAELLRRGAKGVVLKQGEHGSLYAGPDGRIVRGEAFAVKVVDTTAAGDAMTAGLAVALGEGMDWPDALRFANAAGATACTVFGALPSLPTRAKVTELMSEQRH